MGETVLKQLTNETNRMLDQVIRDLKRLPYDEEIEYLESTGTQWIDLGVSVSDPSTITIEADETVCQQIGFTHQNNANGTWIARYAPVTVPESLYIYHNKYNNRNIIPPMKIGRFQSMMAAVGITRMERKLQVL